MSLWIYRNFVFVPAASVALANTLAAQLDPDTGGQDTFSIPLSEDGNEPAAYFGCNSLATEAIQEGLRQMLESGAVPGTLFWRLGAAANTLQLTNCEASLPRYLQLITWSDALTDAGLQVITPEFPL